MTAGSASAARDATAQPTGASPAFGDAASADAAHRTLRSDASIQFDFPPFSLEPRKPPRWLVDLFEAIGSFIQWVGGGWTVLMWAALALVVLAILVAAFPPARAWLANRLARRGTDAAPNPGWAPAAATARALLVEADQLAAAGDYDAAVRLLLHRSVEDIERWRGDLLRPSLTARDIGRIDQLPESARAIFSRIVADVERSLFAGHPLGAADWARARADYAGFALGR
ncbi:hypothetical protein [Sphingomonas sp.]|uniref:hypothetical protein n=1 Tax=Sphingomonas sp. TaxID=28214 RepID=UPI00307D1357